MNIGYARVSTQDQNLELQCEALAKTLEMLRDTLVVWKPDRPGASFFTSWRVSPKWSES
jgi:DNA invertase Pin-like site-specific DNA recombinase